MGALKVEMKRVNDKHLVDEFRVQTNDLHYSLVCTNAFAQSEHTDFAANALQGEGMF